MISKSLIIVVILGVLSLIVSASAISPQAEAMMDSRQQFKRFRGEPIRFGKRVPREPIRFGKRVPVFEPYFDY